jgi:hypothetical protein
VKLRLRRSCAGALVRRGPLVPRTTPSNVIRAVMPHFRKQRSGYIFNISSVAGYKGFGNSPSYAAGEFAVIGLSEALAEEVKEFGVKVTVVAPGFFRTSFLDKGDELVSKNTIDEYHVEQLVDRLRAMNGKQPGDPEKLVAALIDLSNEQNPSVHLLMGPDAYEIVMQKRAAEQHEFEAWKELTLSTDLDEDQKAELPIGRQELTFRSIRQPRLRRSNCA